MKGLPKRAANRRTMRRKFLIAIWSGLRIVWPVLSGLVVAIATLGLIIGRIEGWSVEESIYFAFVSGLTIGYGDFSPKMLIARLLAIVIGICGVLLTALVAAVAVKAFDSAHEEQNGQKDV